MKSLFNRDQHGELYSVISYTSVDVSLVLLEGRKVEVLALRAAPGVTEPTSDDDIEWTTAYLTEELSKQYTYFLPIVRSFYYPYVPLQIVRAPGSVERVSEYPANFVVLKNRYEKTEVNKE